jgi:hypothetical protein
MSQSVNSKNASVNNAQVKVEKLVIEKTIQWEDMDDSRVLKNAQRVDYLERLLRIDLIMPQIDIPCDAFMDIWESFSDDLRLKYFVNVYGFEREYADCLKDNSNDEDVAMSVMKNFLQVECPFFVFWNSTVTIYPLLFKWNRQLATMIEALSPFIDGMSLTKTSTQVWRRRLAWLNGSLRAYPYGLPHRVDSKSNKTLWYSTKSNPKISPKSLIPTSGFDVLAMWLKYIQLPGTPPNTIPLEYLLTDHIHVATWLATNYQLIHQQWPMLLRYDIKYGDEIKPYKDVQNQFSTIAQIQARQLYYFGCVDSRFGRNSTEGDEGQVHHDPNSTLGFRKGKTDEDMEEEDDEDLIDLFDIDSCTWGGFFHFSDYTADTELKEYIRQVVDIRRDNTPYIQWTPASKIHMYYKMYQIPDNIRKKMSGEDANFQGTEKASALSKTSRRMASIQALNEKISQKSNDDSLGKRDEQFEQLESEPQKIIRDMQPENMISGMIEEIKANAQDEDLDLLGSESEDSEEAANRKKKREYLSERFELERYDFKYLDKISLDTDDVAFSTITNSTDCANKRVATNKRVKDRYQALLAADSIAVPDQDKAAVRDTVQTTLDGLVITKKKIKDIQEKAAKAVDKKPRGRPKMSEEDKQRRQEERKQKELEQERQRQQIPKPHVQIENELVQSVRKANPFIDCELRPGGSAPLTSGRKVIVQKPGDNIEFVPVDEHIQDSSQRILDAARSQVRKLDTEITATEKRIGLLSSMGERLSTPSASFEYYTNQDAQNLQQLSQSQQAVEKITMVNELDYLEDQGYFNSSPTEDAIEVVTRALPDSDAQALIDIISKANVVDGIPTRYSTREETEDAEFKKDFPVMMLATDREEQIHMESMLSLLSYTTGNQRQDLILEKIMTFLARDEMIAGYASLPFSEHEGIKNFGYLQSVHMDSRYRTWISQTDNTKILVNDTIPKLDEGEQLSEPLLLANRRAQLRILTDSARPDLGGNRYGAVFIFPLNNQAFWDRIVHEKTWIGQNQNLSTHTKIHAAQYEIIRQAPREIHSNIRQVPRFIQWLISPYGFKAIKVSGGQTMGQRPDFQWPVFGNQDTFVWSIEGVENVPGRGYNMDRAHVHLIWKTHKSIQENRLQTIFSMLRSIFNNMLTYVALRSINQVSYIFKERKFIASTFIVPFGMHNHIQFTHWADFKQVVGLSAESRLKPIKAIPGSGMNIFYQEERVVVGDVEPSLHLASASTVSFSEELMTILNKFVLCGFRASYSCPLCCVVDKTNPTTLFDQLGWEWSLVVRHAEEYRSESKTAKTGEPTKTLGSEMWKASGFKDLAEARNRYRDSLKTMDLFVNRIKQTYYAQIRLLCNALAKLNPQATHYSINRIVSYYLGWIRRVRTEFVCLYATHVPGRDIQVRTDGLFNVIQMWISELIGLRGSIRQSKKMLVFGGLGAAGKTTLCNKLQDVFGLAESINKSKSSNVGRGKFTDINPLYFVDEVTTTGIKSGGTSVTNGNNICYFFQDFEKAISQLYASDLSDKLINIPIAASAGFFGFPSYEQYIHDRDAKGSELKTLYPSWESYKSQNERRLYGIILYSPGAEDSYGTDYIFGDYVRDKKLTAEQKKMNNFLNQYSLLFNSLPAVKDKHGHTFQPEPLCFK